MNSILNIKTKTTQATTHRGNARLWLQNAPEMLQSGFVPNATYSTEYLPSGIVLRLASEGKLRKVSATARGATLDINNSKVILLMKKLSHRAGAVLIKSIAYEVGKFLSMGQFL